MRRQVEEQISLDQSAGRLVEKDKLFVGMCFDELVFEFSIELIACKRVLSGTVERTNLCVYFGKLLSFRFEYYSEWYVFILLLFAFFRQAFWAENFGIWICFVPLAEKYMMLRRSWRMIITTDSQLLHLPLCQGLRYTSVRPACQQSPWSQVSATLARIRLQSHSAAGLSFCQYWDSSYLTLERIPNVPRPPILIRPNRANGADMVVMTLLTTSRMTVTSWGFGGTSGAMVKVVCQKVVDVHQEEKVMPDKWIVVSPRETDGWKS